VPDDDPLPSALDELYGADPEEFMARRTELVKQARADGSAAVAKQIGALRKPTRSAYAINLLARADPDAIGQLLALGEQWRDAEKSVDARQIRELTRSRRRLIDELARAAFAAAAEADPSTAMRDEVVSTLTAALSDESVADEIERGVLVKPARWEGFGLGGPELTLVPSTGDHPAQRQADTRSERAPAARPRLSATERRDAREAGQRAEAERKAQADKEAAEARVVALADARRAVDEAEENLILATDEEQARVDRVHTLEQELADARRAVDEARREVRRAEIAQRRAQDGLRRLESAE
jgi:hypothetical protein